MQSNGKHSSCVYVYGVSRSALRSTCRGTADTNLLAPFVRISAHNTTTTQPQRRRCTLWPPVGGPLNRRAHYTHTKTTLYTHRLTASLLSCIDLPSLLQARLCLSESLHTTITSRSLLCSACAQVLLTTNCRLRQSCAKVHTHFDNKRRSAIL